MYDRDHSRGSRRGARLLGASGIAALGLLLVIAAWLSAGTSGPARAAAGRPAIPTVTDFPLPQDAVAPHGITAGPDGNLWFTLQGGNQIGRMTPAGLPTGLFPLPMLGSQPESITRGPDNNLWFTEIAGNKIGQMTALGALTEYALPDPDSQPETIITGSDGNLWFTTAQGAGVGRITPQGQIDFPVPAPCRGPGFSGITRGPGGSIWFTQASADLIGWTSPQGSCQQFPVPAGSYPIGIAAGPDGNLWFTAFNANYIGRMTPQGDVTRYPLPTPDSAPQAITLGPDDNLWFTEHGIAGTSNKIGRITPEGVIEEYATRQPSSTPYGITTGPDGNVWFTESVIDAIGRLSFTAPATATPTVAATETPAGPPIPPGAAGVIAGGPGIQDAPDVDHNIVVWEDNSAGTFDIRAKDLAGGPAFALFEGSGDQRFPAISGNLVVWQDNRNGDWDIFGARLSGGAAGPAFAIASGPGDQTHPAVSGNIVTWESSSGGHSDVVALDLGGGAARTLSSPSTTNLHPAVSGNTVVWQSTVPTTTLQMPAAAGDWDILGIDLTQGGAFAITSGGGQHTNPAIDGSLVVWQQFATGGPQAGHWTIAGFDLSTHTFLQITTAPGDQTDPAIGDGQVVYLGAPPTGLAAGPPDSCSAGTGPRRAVRQVDARHPAPDPSTISADSCAIFHPRTRQGHVVWHQAPPPPSPPTADADVYGNVCTISFSDVQPSDYFYGPVQALYCVGAIGGYGDNTFRPYNETTRGQLAKIIVLGEGWPLDTAGGPHFGDVPASSPFYPFVETAFNRGVISGYGDGTFRPYADVTRGQLAKIIVGAQGWAINTTGGPHFGDVPASNPFYVFVETAFNRGIISGYGDGTFRVGANATRGQIAKIVWGALQQP